MGGGFELTLMDDMIPNLKKLITSSFLKKFLGLRDIFKMT